MNGRVVSLNTWRHFCFYFELYVVSRSFHKPCINEMYRYKPHFSSVNLAVTHQLSLLPI